VACYYDSCASLSLILNLVSHPLVSLKHATCPTATNDMADITIIELSFAASLIYGLAEAANVPTALIYPYEIEVT
jgi:hypothetical protein